MRFPFFLSVLFFSSSLFAQTEAFTLSGSLNDRYTVHLDLQQSQQELHGYYHYDKVGEPIILRGNREGNSFTLTEETLGGTETGKFTGSIHSDGTWKGTWVSIGGDREFSFAFSEAESEGLSFELLSLDKRESLFDGFESPACSLEYEFLEPKSQNGKPVSTGLKTSLYQAYFGPDPESDDPLENFQVSATEYLSDYHEAAEGQAPGYCFGCEWSFSKGVEVLYNRNEVLSMGIGHYQYSGGAHGSFGMDYFVYDLELDRELRLEDLFRDPEDPALVAIIERAYLISNGFTGEEELASLGLFVQHLYASSNFFVTPGGVGFHYGLYEIAPYVAGTTDLFVYMADLEPFIKEDSPIRRFLR